MVRLWKVMCQENKYPGMWQRWYRNQCVAVGWGPNNGFHLDGPGKSERGWSRARNAIKEMRTGDYVVAALQNHRVGRLGMIISKAITDDEWQPIIDKSLITGGAMGRRILVRWDLTVGPEDQDYVVKLPEENRFTRGELLPAVSLIQSISSSDLCKVMNDQTNWVNLLGGFEYERALSDYIANYPNRLEAGLLSYPDAIIKEHVFKNKKRLDVLLIDEQKKAVIVECKQNSPTIENVNQLAEYMDLLATELDERNSEVDGKKKMPRGILVHGGSAKVSTMIIEAAKKSQIEIVSYRLEINFLHNTAVK